MKGSIRTRALRAATLVTSGALVWSLAGLSAQSVAAQSSGPVGRQLLSGGTVSLSGLASTEGSDALANPEFAPSAGDGGSFVNIGGRPGTSNGAAAPAVASAVKAAKVNRSATRDHEREHAGDVQRERDKPNTVPTVRSARLAGGNPELKSSFTGLNFRNQRTANGGNQFSVEPPDQGLCTGNGYVLETVNDVLRVFDMSGNALTGVVDQNTFYGYPAAFNRPSGPFGPELTDPSCYYDPDTGRFFHVVLTLFTNPTTGALTFKNSLDIAVSNSGDPRGSWHIYHLPVQNDGTDGTPDHGCPLNDDGTGHAECIGDYPHIGADKYGFYITTNEYGFQPADFYTGANIYAISKAQLAAGAASPSAYLFFGDLLKGSGTHGFTVWPATSAAGQAETKHGGVEYFLNTTAAEEAHQRIDTFTGFANKIGIWAVVNTSSLDSASPNLKLVNRAIEVGSYGVPPASTQKDGPAPLRDCINDNSNLFGPGLGCWALLFNAQPAAEVLGKLDSLDSRMQQVSFNKGLIYGAHATIVNVDGQQRAGIAYYVVRPNLQVEKDDHNLKAEIEGEAVRQGYLALANNNLIMPAIGVTADGSGAMAMTLVGPDYYPSAAYVTLDEKRFQNEVHVAGAGLGPQDGFSEYNAFSGSGVARPRWGDYGATATDGNKIVLASEFIAQTCTLSQWLTSPIGSCGGTRAALGNWATRISVVTP